MYEYQIGNRVEKHTGAYSAFGEVRAAYTTRNGAVRYVVEVEPQGMQMIWSGKELRPAPLTVMGASKETCTIKINGSDFVVRKHAAIDYGAVVTLSGVGGYPFVKMRGADGILTTGEYVYATDGMSFTCIDTGAA